MDSEKLQNAIDVVAFCQWKQIEECTTYLNATRIVFQFFHLVKLDDVDRFVV
jgi:hypothetical protein